MSGLTNTNTSIWYAAIHDILPTHDFLAAIHLVPTTLAGTVRTRIPFYIDSRNAVMDRLNGLGPSKN